MDSDVSKSVNMTSPIDLTMNTFSSGEASGVVTNNWQWWQNYPSYPYYGNITDATPTPVTYLYITEDKLREIVREEVTKAVEGLGKQVRRKTGVRKAE